MRLRRASRGSLVITRFTRSETPAVCPRWLRWLRHGQFAGRSLPLASPGVERQLSVWLRWLRHGQFAGRSLPLASPGVERQLSVYGGWLGVIGEPGSVARWLERELRAALPLGTVFSAARFF